MNRSSEYSLSPGIILDILVMGGLLYYDYYALALLCVPLGASMLYYKKTMSLLIKDYQFRSRVEAMYASDDGLRLYVTTYPQLKNTKRVMYYDLVDMQFVAVKDGDAEGGVSKFVLTQHEVCTDLSFAVNYPPEKVDEGFTILLRGEALEIREWLMEKILSADNKRRHSLTELEEMLIEREKDPLIET